VYSSQKTGHKGAQAPSIRLVRGGELDMAYRLYGAISVNANFARMRWFAYLHALSALASRRQTCSSTRYCRANYEIEKRSRAMPA
jgi:hypothetical protein